ncbi:hypothetical protein K474DRAFT_1579546, partial [Panus rudis PR-1116 ss-1]
PHHYSSPADVEQSGEFIQRVMDDAWRRFATPRRQSKHSKSWWNAECTDLNRRISTARTEIRKLRSSMRRWKRLVQENPARHAVEAPQFEDARVRVLTLQREVETLRKEFRVCTRRAKRKFFDDIITSSSPQRIWDFVQWTKPRRVGATFDLVRSDGTSIDSQEELSEAFQRQFTPNNPCPIDASLFDEIPQRQEREFPPISRREIFDALQNTSNTSAPGPDHCGWDW